ncbi:MAG TPA: hypothetical protein PK890_03685 [Terrimesophilobacter sp.]|nr:hypothetical protein [Terrimesophilobacter sp.]
MDFWAVAFVVVLGVLFVWGLVAPRSQWRLLLSWTYREPQSDAPSGWAFGVQRVVAGLGIAGLLAGGGLAWQRYLDALPEPPPPPNPIEQMWGDAGTVVVNRVVAPSSSVPSGLVRVDPSAYHAMDGQRRQPAYLFSVPTMGVPHGEDAGGLVGEAPAPGLVGLDTARVVVLVSADSACIPREVFLQEGPSTVRVAVYFGRPDLADGTEHWSGRESCKPGSSGARSLLIPLPLATPLGERLVTDLDGVPLRRAPILERAPQQ